MPTPSPAPARTEAAAPLPPSDATVLRHCRCQDCRHWHDDQGYCDELLFRRYVPREDYPPAMRPFWTEVGRIRPDQWHYCAHYYGPQISKDVWVWRYDRPQAAQVGAGSTIAPEAEQPDNDGVLI